MLPSKTAPSNRHLASSNARSTAHAKKNLRKVKVEEVEDEDTPRNVSACNPTPTRASSADPPATNNNKQYRTEKNGLFLDTSPDSAHDTHPRSQAEQNATILYTPSTKLFPIMRVTSQVILVTGTIAAVMEIKNF